MAAIKSLDRNNSGFLNNINASGDIQAVDIDFIKQSFVNNGYLHISNTGIKDIDELSSLLPKLGFGQENLFNLGGRTSKDWQEKWVADGLRRMDYYPPNLTLLPNNEVQYQRSFPTKILFFMANASINDGKNFVHSAKAVELYLANTSLGRGVLDRLRQFGMIIQTGFLDKNHPKKSDNYFQSWQERFGTDDPDIAISTAKSLNDEYDEVWWRETDGYMTLMTEINLPSFFTDKLDNNSYLRFPRIAMDEPHFKNGFRQFPLGNGTELSDAEKELIKQAYFETRQGSILQVSDILLMDNIRFAHSREPFKGKKELLVSMAGFEKID